MGQSSLAPDGCEFRPETPENRANKSNRPRALYLARQQFADCNSGMVATGDPVSLGSRLGSLNLSLVSLSRGPLFCCLPLTTLFPTLCVATPGSGGEDWWLRLRRGGC
ncbi:hypothetical protein NL676_008580 [Syzygium grande]|nr:hypothetical protein NL676_008580 [Syzygium grande]